MRIAKATLSFVIALSALAWSAASATPMNLNCTTAKATQGHVILVHNTDGSELLWKPRDNLTDTWSLGEPAGDPDSFDRIYERAQLFGDAISELRLGLKYYKGEGVKQDFASAAKWLRLSAQQGNHTAQAILGYQYYSGAGVPRGPRRGASLGDPRPRNPSRGEGPRQRHLATGVHRKGIDAGPAHPGGTEGSRLVFRHELPRIGKFS